MNKFPNTAALAGKILITGGTGSLGTAILERALQDEWNASFTILARNETKMSQTLNKYPHVRGEIGDVRDRDWLTTIFPGHDIVIHAAAIKQVPTAESNVREAILTNVQGSMNVATAAVEAEVKQVIGISTDKACNPTTVYGNTKALMEGIFREAANWSDTSFLTVRYGNVLRSNASVVPFFEKLIKEDKPFTITDLRMTRFWLSMPQAIDIILDALDINYSGTVLVPRPPALSMIDLAKYLDPNREVVEIGIRPGEKVHEQLIHPGEALHTGEYRRDWRDYFVIHPPGSDLVIHLDRDYEYNSRDIISLNKEDFLDLLSQYDPD